MSDPITAPDDAAPVDTPLPAKIKNEIILSQRLENLNVQASSLSKAFVNSFLGKRSREYKEWQSIGEQVEREPLTDEGRLRLKIKHELMGDRVVPNHSVLLLTAAPFILYWVLRKGGTYLVSSRLEAYQKTQARNKRRLDQAKAKETKKLSKTSAAKAPRRGR